MTTPDHNAEEQQASVLDQAMAAFQEALGLLDPENEPGTYGVVLHDIADVYKAMGEDLKAIDTYQEAVQYKQRGNDPGDLATTLAALGDLLIDRGELTQARTVLDEAKRALSQESTVDAVSLHSLGQAYERLGRMGSQDAYAEALTVYNLALRLLDADTDPGSYATVMRDVGDVHKAQGRLNEAVAAYEQAVEHMRRRPGAQRHVASLLIALGRARRRMGWVEDASSTPDDTEGDLA